MRLWRGLPALVLAGLLLRLTFSFVALNIHLSDEVFQYLEQAHRFVFGYGLIPWEFRFGSRSWLRPLALAAPLHLCKLVGVDDPASSQFLVKALLCLLSVSLIVSCYRIGRNLVSESAGRLAALLACFWYELVYFAPRPMPEVLSTYFLLAALASVTDPRRGRRPVLFGLCVGLAVALRVQYLPAAGFLALLAIGRWSGRALVRSAVALVGVGLLAGYVDKLSWGSWFASHYSTYEFNVVRDASALFGTSPADRHVLKLGVASAGLLPLAALASLGFARRLWILMVTLFAIVGVHTMIPHKEYRFIVAAIPVLLVLMAG